MKKSTIGTAVLILIVTLIACYISISPLLYKPPGPWDLRGTFGHLGENVSIIQLPEPRYQGNMSIEATILQRRSVRDYKREPLSLGEISQLLWAAQGITDKDILGYPKRTAPSAGALYPLEIYLVTGEVIGVSGLNPGVYHYIPDGHMLIRIGAGNIRDCDLGDGSLSDGNLSGCDLTTQLSNAALSQSCVKDAPVNLIITAVYNRTTERYGTRGIRYVHLEAGHAAQNIYLQAVSLNLGTVVIGAFYDDQVRNVLNISNNETPLYIMPIGRI